MRKLGTKQSSVLRAIRDHGRWYRGCGWVWGTTNETEKILQTLVVRQLVTTADETWTDVYRQPYPVKIYSARPQVGEPTRKETE